MFIPLWVLTFLLGILLGFVIFSLIAVAFAKSNKNKRV